MLCVLVPNTRAHFAHRSIDRSIIMHSTAHLGVILILKLQWTQAPTGICLSMSRNSHRQSSIFAMRAQRSGHSATTFFTHRLKKLVHARTLPNGTWDVEVPISQDAALSGNTLFFLLTLIVLTAITHSTHASRDVANALELDKVIRKTKVNATNWLHALVWRGV